MDQPDLTGVLHDYEAALLEVLNGPGLWPDLGPGTKVALVVDDPSRWTPVREALPIVLRSLHSAGICREDISISVGVGRHAVVDQTAMRMRVGEDIANQYACFSPPVDDRSAYIELGRLSNGIPIRVFRPVADATFRILIGSVLPHLQAGFGGGYKLIFPGCCHRTTLSALHRCGLDGDMGRLLGTAPAENPMRQAIREAARLLPGPCLSISHLLARPGEILRVAAGPTDRVQDDLSREAARRFKAPRMPAADLAIVGNWPWPGDPMQSFKTLLNHRAACRPGGILAGFFWTDPAEVGRSFPVPALKTIAAAGEPGGWLLRRGLASADWIFARVHHPASFMIRWARELVLDRTVFVYSPVLHERFGGHLGPVSVFREQSSLWDEVARRLNRAEAPLVRVFPQGGLSYCAGFDGEKRAS